VKQRSKSRGETRVKRSVKHARKRMKKHPSPTCYIHGTVTTLILNEYRQSSNSSVLVFKFKVQRQLRMPIARYCMSVELVRVRSDVDS
jgi:hypothetical protein